MRHVRVAATQMQCTADKESNIAKAERLVREAAAAGAQIIPPAGAVRIALFLPGGKSRILRPGDVYRGEQRRKSFLSGCQGARGRSAISFFEKRNQACFNSIAVIDADGSVMGVYRKTHIPDGPGYEEKYYFNPGDTGFRVWQTRYARIGIASAGINGSRKRPAACSPGCRSPFIPHGHRIRTHQPGQ